MYSLLVSAGGWENRRSLENIRIFEYTEERLRKVFKPNGVLEKSKILQIPALFVSEINSGTNQLARVGYISRIEMRSTETQFEFHFDSAIPPIPNELIQKLSEELDIEKYELNRTHWAVKEVDLFRVLLKNQPFFRLKPQLFRLDESEAVDSKLVSVMMPFARDFDKVYEKLQTMARELSLRCLRADDIWEHDVIIQDSVCLINRSRIVICDCTNRNPNVFYETGIAHTLGKDVILITQNGNDIPFDLRHVRYLLYLDNEQGRAELVEKVADRIQTLLQ